ncbi:uncharacterized protein LOC110022130 [Phalaenopsis equestris]|uniref:uncharacterized protein LOC110022130 n=1 Tax=Phalaenopsis equestris TaxID=78828 RepID=UPI0009E2102B|nr:uncharacterized protein LOC110022130 [Phalaenopsis equestris]
MCSMHGDFINQVAKAWTDVHHHIPNIKLWLLHKKVSKHLTNWNWKEVGNIDKKVLEAEQNVLHLEQLLSSDMGSEMDLQSANDNLLDLINMQEALYAQKANKIRFCEGDKNSKYYHACINYRRKSSTIHKILSQEGHWISNAEGIANAAVHYFQKLFRENSISHSTINETLFDKEREFTNSLSLTNIPDENEIWEALKSIDSTKVAGPDGFSADFYKKALHIVKGEIIAKVQSFF